MKFNIVINQKAFIENNLLGKIDLTDLVIFDFVYDFFNCDMEDKITFEKNGEQYVEIKLSLLKNQMPILGEMSKRTFINRMNKLINVGLIERYENNQTENRSAYKKGVNWSIFKFDRPKKTNSYTYENNFTPPMKENAHNNIYRNNNNIENNKKEDTNVSKKAKTNWRADIEVYRKACDDAFNILADDKECEANLIKLYPNIDYYRTIKKSLIFWESEKGWEYKKKSKSVNIDMVSTLKKNLDKSIVYKNVNDKPIQNERLLHIRFADKEEGTLVDGTIFKGGYRYYYSQKDNRSYSIPVDAIERPDDRYEWDNKKGWYLPDDKICLDDVLW